MISEHLTTTLQAVSNATEGLQRRTNLLWWKEALFSPSGRMSYRDMMSFEAAALMAFDLHRQIPTFSPASVAAFLRETVMALPSFDQEAKTPIVELVQKTRDADVLSELRIEAGKLVRRLDGARLDSGRDRPFGRCATDRRARVPRSRRGQAAHRAHDRGLVGLGFPRVSGGSGGYGGVRSETPDSQEAGIEELGTMAECAQETCFWSDGAGCSLGHLDPSECSALKAAPAAKQDDKPSPDAVAPCLGPEVCLVLRTSVSSRVGGSRSCWR